MMKKMMIFAGMLFACVAVTAADRIAVAEPVARGGVKPAEIEAMWSMLESSVGGGFEVVSRAALKAMLTEIELTENSGLVDLNSTQKAALGRLKGVKYILTSTVGVMGKRINFSLALVDASTGEADPEKRCFETVNSLDDLADRLPDMLNEIGLGKEAKKRGRSALLAPMIKVHGAPGYLAEDFNTGLEEILLDKNIRLQNLKSVAKILHDNNIPDLEEAEPAMFARVGGLLRVDYLLMPTINRFSCTMRREYIRVTRKEIVRCTGELGGSLRIVSAATGELIASVPFRCKIDFDDIDEDTDEWSGEDFGKYLIGKCVAVVGEKTAAKVK